MNDFTNDDRERQVRTLTVLEEHVKLSNERHLAVIKFKDDHEDRIRKNEKVGTRVTLICSLFLTGITALIYTAARKIVGG